MGNNSGIDHTVINSRERALSTDLNVLQSQAGKSRAEMFRRLAADSYQSQTMGLETVLPQGGTPLDADIFGGLRVRIMSDHLLVTPGTIGSMSAIGTPDANDSQYVLIDDPGVQLSGTLTFVINGGPGIRVDVVECQPVETVITTDNRDRFNPTTGLFSPETVNKTVGGRLTFRIRQGTEGAGYPGNVAGWLPLAVAIHPSPSASFADVFFFDVRPLVMERNDVFYKNFVTQSLFKEDMSRYSSFRTGGNLFMEGDYDFNAGGPNNFLGSFGPYRCRGRIQNTAPGLPDTGDFELNNVVNLVPGADFSAVGNKWMYVLAMFPEGLPRWVSYTTTTLIGGERYPGDAHGILALTDQSTTPFSQTGFSGITSIPDVYGLTSTVNGCPIVGIARQSGTAVGDFDEFSRMPNGRMRWPEAAFNNGMQVSGTVTSFTATSEDIEWDLGDFGEELTAFNNFLPHTCTAFKFKITLTFNIDVNTPLSFTSVTLTRGAGRIVMSQNELFEVSSDLQGPNANITVTYEATFVLPGAGSLAPQATTGNFFIDIQAATGAGTNFATTNRALTFSEMTVGV